MDKKYNEQIEINKKLLTEATKKSNMLGNVKLLLIILLGAEIVFRFFEGYQIFLTALTVVTLIYFWIYHAKIGAKIERFKALISINEKYLARIDGNWINFQDIGKEFADLEHTYARDLDIVGEKSLFQLLNITNTSYGRKQFADDLLNPNYNKEEIERRQEAIKELSKDILFSNEFQYLSSKIDSKQNIKMLLDNMKKDIKFIDNKILRIILKYLPLLTVPFILAIYIFQIKDMYAIAVNILVAQLLIWGLGVLKTNFYFSSIAGVQYNLNNYSNLMKLLEETQFNSHLIKNIKSKLFTGDKSATKAMKELERIMQKINVRYNFLIYVFLNAVLLWDYECAFSLEDWRKKYAVDAEDWFLAIGEFESLLSFSSLSNITENTCFPNILPQDVIYKSEEIGHPLISNSYRVYNDIEIDKQILIISGSNMSGKTTFLRTVGINLVLAQAGCCVCAKNMSNSIFKIATSMRIADDLSGGISTFYAELKKVKNIIDVCQTNKNAIFLIDEIFRGTNSVDRIEGARTVISSLNNLGAVGMITTHDLELCSLSELGNILNLSFSEYYENNEIKFDYKMKKGISNTTNAKYLMEMIGIYSIQPQSGRA